MPTPIDPRTANAADLAIEIARLEERAAAAKADLDQFQRAVRERYAPYTLTLSPGTHNMAAEDGTPIKVVIREESKWDSDALGALLAADNRFSGVIRVRHDVLLNTLKRAPTEAQEMIMECVTIVRKEPTITIGNGDKTK